MAFPPIVAAVRRAHLVLGLSVIAAGCYASHERDGGARVADARVADARVADAWAGATDAEAALCTFSYLSAAGERVNCVVTNPEAACDDAARCVCIARLGGSPTDDELAACLLAERTPRALITFSDFCVFELDMQEALAGYFQHEGGATIAPACADVPARFGP